MKRWPIVGATVVLVGAAAWLALTPIPLLKEELRVSEFWILTAVTLAVVATTMAGLRQIAAVVRGRDRVVLAVCALAFALVLVAPRTNRIFYDEQIYQGIARNLSDLHLAQMCNDGTVEYGRLQCWRAEYNKQPYGYPYLLSLGYRLAGVSDGVAHWLNVSLSAATAGALFLLTLLLTGDRLSAGLAGVSFALIPEQLRWSHTAASEPSAAFVCTLAVLAAAAFVRLRTTTALVWVACAASFAAYFRPETVLVLPVVAVMIVVSGPSELGRTRMWWVAVLGVLLLVPEFAHLAAVRGEGWGTSDQRFSLAYVTHNLWTNGVFYLADHRFPPILTVLAIAGLTQLRASVALAAWWLLFWGVFLFFYAGSYDYGADVRYSLLSYPPLAVLAGIGGSRIAAAVQRVFPAITRAGAGVAAVLLFQSMLYLPWVRAVGEEAWAARADVAFAKMAARELPANAIVLTHNPSMFHTWGVSAAQLSIATEEPDYVRGELARRYAGGVYLHWNFWCYTSDPAQVRFCEQARANYPVELTREGRERDYRFALYRLLPTIASDFGSDSPGQ
jgi:Dolichyl-phosphate-mannose-protein mannosyltransferase